LDLLEAQVSTAEADTATMDNQLSQAPREDLPIRTELVERVRREIAAGTYETPDKWEIALSRLLDRLES
jgi:hypothetical protein